MLLIGNCELGTLTRRKLKQDIKKKLKNKYKKMSTSSLLTIPILSTHDD
ncbi:hypothetical protein PUN28_000787 [Cardiocondyla obscurior]|uniref:Uncharacterized protein n=1 Tax=Cardiocondyla obscurior TaxID=286306 RepID=A0AAW2H0Z7_9HYME